VEKDSDWFTPRQEHAACNTWDQKLWVFGGQNFIGERTNFLNDLLYYDELSNKWVEIKPKGPVPKPRHGHLMFCYYNYLVVYGGQGENQHIYGDLWMFDVVKEDWH
jgi:N-acetylneuraminic acid mutarotase